MLYAHPISISFVWIPADAYLQDTDSGILDGDDLRVRKNCTK